MKRIAKLIKAGIPFVFTGSTVEPEFPAIEDAVKQAVKLYGDKVDPEVTGWRLEVSENQISQVFDPLNLQDRFFWYELEPYISYYQSGLVKTYRESEIDDILRNDLGFTEVIFTKREDGPVTYRRPAWNDNLPVTVIRSCVGEDAFMFKGFSPVQL